MATLGDEVKTIVLGVVEFLGEAVSFTRETQGNYDASTGETIAPTILNYSGFGVPGNYTNIELEDTTVRATDIKLTVGGLSEVPQQGDLVVVDSVSYRVQNIVVTRLTGTTVLYEMQIRL